MDRLLNQKTQNGLRAQFSQDRTTQIIEQAHSAYHHHNPHSKNNPELYELLEGGFIDESLETLGFGHWAIGRPKIGNGNGNVKRRITTFRHNTPDPGPEKPQIPQLEFESETAISLFLRHIPSPNETRRPIDEWSNAIEYRNILVVGDQGSGKTTLCRSLVEGIQSKWTLSPVEGYEVNAWIQEGGIDRLLAYGTRGSDWSPHIPRAWFLVGEDLTLVKLNPVHVNWFFKVRHLIQRNTGTIRGLVVTSFNTHTLFGIDKNLRTRFTMMFVKSIPTNPYDRSLLKKYFDPGLLDRFEKTAKDDDVLVWDRFNTRGVWTKVPLPQQNLLRWVPEYPLKSLRWDIRWAYAVVGLFVAILGWALYKFVEVGLRIIS